MTEHYVILGYGVTGQSVLKYLLNSKHNELAITIFDQKYDFTRDSHYQELFTKHQNISTINKIDDLINITINFTDNYAIASPGIKPELYYDLVVNKLNIKLLSDIQLFIDGLSLKRDTDKSDIFAITGTNGKSTVCALLHCLLNNQNQQTALGGNFGLAVPDLLIDDSSNNFLDYVLELSSYQLELTNHLPCLAATCLNLSPNHLDWHHGLDNYFNAKLKIYDNSDFDILNLDDDQVLNNYLKIILPKKVKQNIIPQIILYTIENNKNKIEKICQNLNEFAPQLQVLGIFNYDNEKNSLLYNDINIIELNELPPVLQTRHNISNVLAVFSLLVAKIVKQHNIHDLDKIIIDSLNRYLEYLPLFKGLPYRCQLIKEDNNIKIFNDSKSTNLTATIKALESVAHVTNNKIILILGGIVKEDIDNDSIRSLFIKCLKMNKGKIDTIIVLSKDNASQAKFINLINESNKINSTNISIITSIDLTTTINDAFSLVNQGDVILFSPGGASFDLFKNYISRGDEFNSACLSIAY